MLFTSDTPAEGLLLNQLYDQLRLFTNFFEPTMRLKSKERLMQVIPTAHNNDCIQSYRKTRPASPSSRSGWPVDIAAPLLSLLPVAASSLASFSTPKPSAWGSLVPFE
jgi:hypothetical protein